MPLITPERFRYRNLALSKLSYRQTPPGAMSFRNGAVAFAYNTEDNSQGEWHNRVLVLADPLLRYYSHEDFAQVLITLKQLSEEHLCYCVNSIGLIVPFEAEYAQCTNSPLIQGIKAVPLASITAQMAALGYEENHICILDSLSLHNAPFTPNYQLLSQLSQTDALEIASYLSLQRLEENFGISLDDATDWDEWLNLCALLPNNNFNIRLGTAWAYEQLSLDTIQQQRVKGLFLDFDADDISNNSPDAWQQLQQLSMLKMLTFHPIMAYFNSNSLSSVKHLDLSHSEPNLDRQELCTWLNALPNLEHLDLHMDRGADEDEGNYFHEASETTLTSTLLPLLHLKILNVSGWSSESSMEEFTLKCPELIHLYGAGRKLPMLFSKIFGKLSQLQILNLSNNNNPSEVQKLLTSSKQLTDLRIEYTMLDANNCYAYPHLKTLHAQDVSFTVLANIINDSYHINTLILKQIDGVFTKNTLTAHCNHLKNLTLFDLSSENIDQLLFPSLIHLEINDCKFFTGNVQEPLTQLQHLNLKNLTLKSEYFFRFFQPMVHLKKLTIDKCKFENFSVLNFSCLAKLQQLTLIDENYSSYLSDELFTDLLDYNDHLQFLKLADCFQITQLNPTLSCWPNLKVLQVEGASLNSSLLSQTLQQCQALEYLSLTSCLQDPENFLFSLVMPNTYHFHFEEQNISTAQIQNIIIKMPALRQLILTFDYTEPNERDELESPCYSLSNVTHLEIHSFGNDFDNIQAQWLTTLLLAFPLLETLIVKQNISDDLDLSQINFSRLTSLETTDFTLWQHALEHAPLTTACRSRFLALQKEAEQCDDDDDDDSTLSLDHFRSAVATDQGIKIGMPTFSPSHNVRTIFFAQNNAPIINPMYYRLAIHDRVTIDEDDMYFIPVTAQFESRAFPSNSTEANQSTNSYRATLDLRFSEPGEKHYLPSLSAHEILQAWHSDTEGLALFYDSASQRYAVSAAASLSTTISFTVTIAEPVIVACPELDALIHTYQSYQARELTGTSVRDIVDQVGTDGIGGACRFRTASFLQKVTVMNLPAAILVREIANDCHSFIELSIDGGFNWQTKDLGGVSAEITYVNPPANKTPIAQLSLIPRVVKPSSITQALPRLQALSQPTPSITPQQYAQQIKASANRQRLIEFATDADLTAFQACYLALYSHDPLEPIFCVNGPEDLNLALQRLSLLNQHDGAAIHIQTESTAALRDFKNRYQHQNATIFINWRQFTPTEIARYNSIIDAKRRFHDEDFPMHFRIISLITKGYYRGPDLPSRHIRDALSNCPCDSAALQQAVQQYYSQPLTLAPQIINLYHSNDWQALLLGALTLNETGLTFKHGALLKSPMITALAIRNAPWQIESFRIFWQDFYLTHAVTLYGQRFDFTALTQLSYNEGYDDLAQLQANCYWTHTAAPSDAYPLNPAYVSFCYSSYRVNDNRLYHQAGWLSENGNLTFSLTRNLSLGEWCRLLTQAQQLHCQLIFHVPAHVNLPDELQSSICWQEQPIAQKVLAPAAKPAILCLTTDTYAAANALKREWPHALVLNINQRECHDWFKRIDDIVLNPAGVSATLYDSDLWRALEAGQHVILHGEFSQAQADYLACFFSDQPYYLFEGQRLAYQGCLICISTSDLYFDYVQAENRCLLDGNPLPDAFIQHEATIFPDQSNSENANDLDRTRLNSILHLLKSHPYVVIEGNSDAGKTHLLLNRLALITHATVRIYVGMTKINAWLDDQNPGRKLLILDDLRSADLNLTMLPDFANNPPTYFQHGKYRTLSSDHQMVCSAHVDQVSALFKQGWLAKRPVRFVLQDLPTWYLQAQLDVLFAALPINVREQLTQTFWQTVEQQAIPPSIATLKNILLLINIKLQSTSPQSELNFNWPLIFDSYHIDQSAALFSSYFELQAPTIDTSRFVMTPSRYPAYCQLQAMLGLRELKQSPSLHPQLARAVTGGFNAFLMMGEAGLGKSELLEYCIETNGLVSADLHQTDTRPNIYYTLSPAADEAEITRILLKAFHEGAVVIVHELSALKVSEAFVKSLLAGFSPNGPRANKPGFILFAAQNPISYQGRRRYNSDFSSCFAQHELTEYPDAELQIMLQRQCSWLSREQQSVWVNQYQQQRHAAQHDPAIQAPTIREWLRTIVATAPLPNSSSDPVASIGNKRAREVSMESIPVTSIQLASAAIS